MDDSDLAERVDCHYWLKPGWSTPRGDTLICEQTKAEAIAALKLAYRWDEARVERYPRVTN
jgi:hypothetical protein